ncbi:pilus assembly protein [Abyssibius alkaniclasticus]|uniref:Flp family type IVb pilin n=1 Tax=Abyssibius alkaniclasticus TaxID=2881234 RepID=UPI0023644A78|nr:pilus assembly protein [Abyssibius alkaniclasticus]UPH71455.1 pilus assembly protein [Abyssibius alkaniclasticus]
MKLLKMTKLFAKDEDGAVTVDWVVLTAAIVGIAIAVAATIETGLNNAAVDIDEALTGVIAGAVAT